MLKAMFGFRKYSWYKEMNVFEKILMWILCPVVGLVAFIFGYVEGFIGFIADKIL